MIRKDRIIFQVLKYNTYRIEIREFFHSLEARERKSERKKVKRWKKEERTGVQCSEVLRT